MSYKVPYANNQAKLTFVSPYAADRVGIFVPPTVQVSGDGLSPAGTEQGFSVYMRAGGRSEYAVHGVGVRDSAASAAGRSGWRG